MALSITEVKRDFVFEKSAGVIINLTDIDRSMSHEDVINYHTITYPELVSAVLKVDNQGDKIVYKLSENLGTKG